LQPLSREWFGWVKADEATRGLKATLKWRRRVGPEQVAHFAMRPSVEVTEARNDAFFEERFALCGQILMIDTRRALRV
jgi:hypothetical protein